MDSTCRDLCSNLLSLAMTGKKEEIVSLFLDFDNLIYIASTIAGCFGAQLLRRIVKKKRKKSEERSSTINGTYQDVQRYIGGNDHLERKMTTRQKAINTALCIVEGWFFWVLLAMMLSGLIIPMAVTGQLPHIIVNLYFVLIYLIVGAFIGLISKANPWIPLIGTSFAIFLSLAITGKKEEIPLFLDFKNLIYIASIIAGCLGAQFLRRIVKKKSAENSTA